MNRRRRDWCWLLGLLLPAALLAGPARGQVFDASARQFAAHLHLGPIERLGVLHGGRVGILDSFARSQMAILFGKENPQGLSPVFCYLELYFNADSYLHKGLLAVGNADLRDGLAKTLPSSAANDLRRTHRLAPLYLLGHSSLGELALGLRGFEPGKWPDLRQADATRAALMRLYADQKLKHPLDTLMEEFGAFLAAGTFRLIPPDVAGAGWRGPGQLQAHLAAQGSASTIHPSPARARDLEVRLQALGQAWRARDVARTQQALSALAALLGKDPHQPSPAKAWAELLYNRLYRFTIVWVGFAGAFVLMLIAMARNSRRARLGGLLLMALSTLALAVAFALRWWLSGRPWYLPPVTGQFENVIGVAMVGSAMALVLERVRPRNYFALGGSLFAAIALLCGLLLAERMNPGITASRGIVNNWILPLHVGVIIMGYAMIGIGLVLSTLYLTLAVRAARRGPDGQWSWRADLAGPDALGRLAELDRCNLVVAQLACWLVGAGTVLGSYWADYSWGRWWGFDQKETWALITWLVYIAIIHVRFVVSDRRRGLWTAGLTFVGAAVMLFNWIVVTYMLPSLHSYA